MSIIKRSADKDKIWFQANIQLILNLYPDKLVEYDDEEYTWFRIVYWDLPSGWNPQQSSLLIKTPGLKGGIEVPPYGFYLSKYLHKVNGKAINYYFQSVSINDLTDQGYAYYCLHPIDKYWKPSRDVFNGSTYIDAIDFIYEALSL